MRSEYAGLVKYVQIVQLICSIILKSMTFSVTGVWSLGGGLVSVNQPVEHLAVVRGSDMII